MSAAEPARIALHGRPATLVPVNRHDIRLTLDGARDYGIAMIMAPPYPPDHASRRT